MLCIYSNNPANFRKADISVCFLFQASLSEGANPFVIDTDEGDTVETVLDRLLLFPHDERLVTLARESAKDLHSVLPGAERRERINLTVCYEAIFMTIVLLLDSYYCCRKKECVYHCFSNTFLGYSYIFPYVSCCSCKML